MGRDVITIEEAEPTAPVACGACDWTGTADQLEAPDGAILTPGDPSPAGRCPACGALAYLAEAEPAPAPAPMAAPAAGPLTLAGAVGMVLTSWADDAARIDSMGGDGTPSDAYVQACVEFDWAGLASALRHIKAEIERDPQSVLPHPLPLYARALEAGDRLRVLAEEGAEVLDDVPGTPGAEHGDKVTAASQRWTEARNTLHPAVAAYSALTAIKHQAERQIVATMIGDALASGYRVSVNDGEETTVHHSTDPAAIGAAMGTTDEDRLVLHDAVGIRIGWVLLIWGNAEHVVSDYSIGDPRMDALLGEGSAVAAMETLFGA
jgi:hypothetical protein